MGSLIEQKSRDSDDDNRPLHWGRAHIDGAPFRGEPIRIDEAGYEQRVERVSDPKVFEFDLSKPDDAARYKDIIGRITSGIAELISREFLKTATIRQVEIRDAKDRVIGYEKTQTTGLKVHMEWVEFYMQDNKRALV